MSPASATLIALLMYAAGFIPIILMAVWPSSTRVLRPLVGCLVLVFAASQTGIFQGSLTSTDALPKIQPDTSERRCQQVFDLLIDNGIVLDEPDPGALVVLGAAWDQLPPAVQDAVRACAASRNPPPGDADVVEVIRR
ncbi:hypothetical protein GRI75_01310 [Altererythrobacter soli]|uniref:Uncharacterized protein n=1 Tax=Croceibacterium soli TaxID=1739690 RepID=A0A6I4UMS5_9SPHN|nr:hypothetical protein [Croceibacterium soli]MXP40281.1 hypothetical protein [Croceibacterium soli]